MLKMILMHTYVCVYLYAHIFIYAYILIQSFCILYLLQVQKRKLQLVLAACVLFFVAFRRMKFCLEIFIRSQRTDAETCGKEVYK